MSANDDFHRLLMQAEALPDGTAKVAVLEEAVRLADAQLALEHQFAARQQLICAAFAGGSPASMLVAITWCLGVLDTRGGEEDRFDFAWLLWQCKHALSYSPSFVEISYAQFKDLLRDVLARYEQFGASPRSVYMIACSGELSMGHRDAAARYRELAYRNPVDIFAESRPWELYFEVEYLFATGRADEGLELMRPMLESPDEAEEVYSWFVDLALAPLTRSRRFAEAFAHQRRVYRQVAANPKFVDQLGQHIVFLTMMRRFSQAVSIFECHVESALQARTATTRFLFCLDSWFLMDQLQQAGRDTLSVRLPDALGHLSEGGEFPTAAVAAWLQQQYRDLERQLNRRNGNDYMSTLVGNVVSCGQWMRDNPAADSGAT